MESTDHLLKDIKEQLDRIEKVLNEGTSTKTWVDIKEASSYTSLSVTTLRRAVAKCTLKASRRTGKLLFNRLDVDRFLKG